VLNVDFLESLQQSSGSALAELINLVLRACDCSDSVNSDEAADFDGIDRYAEFLDDNADEDDNQKSDGDELSDGENEGNPTTKKKKDKARKKAPRREGQISFGFENCRRLISST
jgi:hypothetical protein